MRIEDIKDKRLFRKAKTHKLSDNEVLNIKQLRLQDYPVKVLAKMFKVSQQTIRYHTSEIYRENQIKRSIAYMKSLTPEEKRRWLDLKNRARKIRRDKNKEKYITIPPA